MADTRRIANASMTSIVRWFGCYDAVAEAIIARWGGGSSKSTISKKMAGQLDWTVADVIALEDASGQYPITRLLARRMEDRPSVDGSLVVQSGVIAKECGEAISAILAAEQSLDANERADAVREIDEAIHAMQSARVLLTADDVGAVK